MKRRLLILGIAVILTLTLLPTAALAYDSGGETYNEHDYNAMVNFLNQPSAVEGQTNAQRLAMTLLSPGNGPRWSGVRMRKNALSESAGKKTGTSGIGIACQVRWISQTAARLECFIAI